jgi:hypothetical protein
MTRAAAAARDVKRMHNMSVRMDERESTRTTEDGKIPCCSRRGAEAAEREEEQTMGN